VRSKIQDALLSALEAILRPIVKLMLQSGIGYSEFASVAKAVFVGVATDDYKRRGRPANFSQVSAMTGISRKEVSRLRQESLSHKWNSRLDTNPANAVLHHWYHDSEYCLAPGMPKQLPFEGDPSFSSLVARYAGDIPAGAGRGRGGPVRRCRRGALPGEGRRSQPGHDVGATACTSVHTIAGDGRRAATPGFVAPSAD
jgi:hypothetical protein